MTADTMQTVTEALRENIRVRPGPALYGVVDGACDLELAYEAKCLYDKQILSLFRGEMSHALADVAPYLVPIDLESGYLECWARRWGTSAGVLLTAPANLEQLHTHLRDVFIAQDEQCQEYFFRFYDPRVLRCYLPTCSADEGTQFFGPITSFIAESESPEQILVCSLADQRVEVNARQI